MEKISKTGVRYVRSLHQKKVRDAEGVFVAEGMKCVSEMLQSFEPVLVVASESAIANSPTGEQSQIAQLASNHKSAILRASAMELEQMSSQKTPQGVLGVFRRPAPVPAPMAVDGLILVLDGVQDPGNLGTIIRTADWFGVRHIVCSRDTADCWNPKVVQATMGALTRVRLTYQDLVPWLEEVKASSASEAPVRVYGTLLNGRNMYEEGAIPECTRGIIIMGNEGNGISEAVRRYVTHHLFIPPYPVGAATSESLNVATATAVILSHFRSVI